MDGNYVLLEYIEAMINSELLSLTAQGVEQRDKCLEQIAKQKETIRSIGETILELQASENLIYESIKAFSVELTESRFLSIDNTIQRTKTNLIKLLTNEKELDRCLCSNRAVILQKNIDIELMLLTQLQEEIIKLKIK